MGQRRRPGVSLGVGTLPNDVAIGPLFMVYHVEMTTVTSLALLGVAFAELAYKWRI